MGFRRNSESHRAWHKWIDQHRDSLIRCGLPGFVYADRLTWLRFLEHGGWHHGLAWSITLLSSPEAAALSDFILSEYGREAYRYLLQNLNDVGRNK